MKNNVYVVNNVIVDGISKDFKDVYKRQMFLLSKNFEAKRKKYLCLFSL